MVRELKEGIMNAQQIKNYMRNQLEFRFPYFDTFNCGEVDMTKLAEDAAQELDLYENDEVPEEVFEIAFEVAEDYEG